MGYIYDVDGNMLTYPTDVSDVEIQGKQDVIWSWWTRPMCVHYVGVRDRVYYGYASQTGVSGVGMYDKATGRFSKKDLVVTDSVDDHNAPCVMVRPDRKLMAAYAGGHNADNMYVRISKYPENIIEWEQEIVLPAEKATYAQLLYVNSKYWLFYRSPDIKTWAYRVSSDGTTWSDERALVVASEQYYCFVATTSDSSKLRVVMTANPQYTDVGFRMGFLDTSTEAVYDADCTTVLRASDASKTTPITNTNFTIVVAKPSSGTQRLFDVKHGTATNTLVLLYATFTWGTATSSQYYIYNNGTSTNLCNGGLFLQNPRYQLGASFLGADKIVIARNANSKDILEIADYSGTVERTLYEENNGSLPIRNARPVVSADGEAIIWQRGYYDSANYTHYDMDLAINYDNETVI